ncbi:hypothetical protein HDU82_005192 [Entophlyctis luteolus]|nr:hypothetical protein HDU82_005192 [Entophlyctis luteolus]
MPEEWECRHCTFVNSAPPNGIACEICLNPRSMHSDGLLPERATLGKATAVPSRLELERERLQRQAARTVSEQAHVFGKASVGVKRKTQNDDSAAGLAKKVARAPGQHKIYLTAIDGYPNTDRYISFAEVLQPSQLKSAFMSAFQLDIHWLTGIVPKNVPVCLALHNPEPTGPLKRDNYTLVFPRLLSKAYSTMHIKLCILFYDSYLRVVISSANLVKYDWDTLENVVWMQDFPRITSKRSLASNDGTTSETSHDFSSQCLGERFRRDLIDLLRDMEAGEWVWRGLDEFDFTQCSARLVVSRPGKFGGDDLRRYGIGRLSSIASEMGVERSAEYDLMYQTSSLGSLNPTWLTDFESAAGGNLLASSTSTSSHPSLKIIYPTVETVQTSRLGANGAGTITWQRKSWVSSSAAHHLLRDSVSKRTGALSHCKIIVCSNATGLDGTDSVDGYYYCGSHNFTMSAWGTVSKSKGTRMHLTVNNWELGVIVSRKEAVIPFETGSKMRPHGAGRASAYVM